MNYCASAFNYQRRASREVMVGRVGVGGANPIRVQSMITCDTMDTEASIAQTMELAAVGCEIVRITAPTVKDSANLQHIVRGLRERGCDVPIVADIHFKPEAAMEAAKWVEKVRINPGNYADSKKFKILEYTDEQYAAELERIRERFTPLVRLCKERGIAMRIGTNHGSLSDRIMNRYGDTPLGMVESALEFARIARDLDYHAFVFSMKSSNPKVMINAYRLLVARLREEGDGLELSDSSRRDRSGRRRRRPDQERDRDWLAPGGWNRRHHSRFADGRQHPRNPGRAGAGRTAAMRKRRTPERFGGRSPSVTIRSLISAAPRRRSPGGIGGDVSLGRRRDCSCRR